MEGSDGIRAAHEGLERIPEVELCLLALQGLDNVVRSHAAKRAGLVYDADEAVPE